jgi:UrcA family protein
MAKGEEPKEPTMIRTAIPVFVVAMLGLAAPAPPAAAQTYDLKPGFSFNPTERIVYTTVPRGDVDPATTSGAQILLGRIEGAADAVCGGKAAAVTRKARGDYDDCRKVAIAVAVAKIRSPTLTVLASSRTGALRARR